ncbi:MAG: peptidylprolyl isomerase [Verrucomicrobia bacterium]|nr:MAG: peptidylprolyl isomerase [Verrucomicrobiota bacterium]
MLSPARRLVLVLLSLASLGVSHVLTAQAAPATVATGIELDDGLTLRFANGIAAVVEAKVITVDDIRRELAPILPQIRRDSRNQQEFNQRLERVQDDIIRNLVDRALIVKEFRKDEKRTIPQSFIDNSISEQLTTQFEGDRARFLAYLKSRGFTLRDYRKEVEEDIIYGYMRGQQRKSVNVVSPARVEAYYAANQSRFFVEEQIRLRIIQINRAGQTDEQLGAKANEILAKFRAGEKFEELAKTFTQDARKSKGGDWGWQKRADLKEAFSEPLFILNAGEVSPPIFQPEGMYLLFAEERKTSGVPPIADVREDIENVLAQQMTREAQEKWLERLRKGAYVRLY